MSWRPVEEKEASHRHPMREIQIKNLKECVAQWHVHWALSCCSNASDRMSFMYRRLFSEFSVAHVLRHFALWQLSPHNYYNVDIYFIITTRHESQACARLKWFEWAHTAHIRSSWHWYKCDLLTEENVRNFLHAAHYHASHLIHQMISFSSCAPLCFALHNDNNNNNN